MKSNKPMDRKLSKHEKFMIADLVILCIDDSINLTSQHHKWLNNLARHINKFYNSPISQRQRIRLYELKRTYFKK